MLKLRILELLFKNLELVAKNGYSWSKETTLRLTQAGVMPKIYFSSAGSGMVGTSKNWRRNTSVEPVQSHPGLENWNLIEVHQLDFHREGIHPLSMHEKGE